MGSLAEQLAEAAKTSQTRSKGCLVTQLLAQLADTDPPGETALREALANPDVWSTTITAVMERNDLYLPAKSVQNHRKGACCGNR